MTKSTHVHCTSFMLLFFAECWLVERWLALSFHDSFQTVSIACVCAFAKKANCSVSRHVQPDFFLALLTMLQSNHNISSERVFNCTNASEWKRRINRVINIKTTCTKAAQVWVINIISLYMWATHTQL